MDDEQAYRQGFEYLRGLVSSLAESQLAEKCPQCPEWSLKDVVAHLMAVAEGVSTAGPPPGFRRRVYESIVNADPADQEAAAQVRDDFWNERVASLQSVAIESLLERWEAALHKMGSDAWRIVADFAVHVGDIEEAIGHGGSREFEMHGRSLLVYGGLLNAQLSARMLPTIRLVGIDPSVSAGDLDAACEVSGPTYELLRAATGRRTAQEGAELLDWQATPDETQALFPVYSWLDESLSGVQIG